MPLKDRQIEVRLIADDKCVARLTDTPVASNGEEVTVYPEGRLMHVTMRLWDSSICSNDLDKRFLANEQRGWLI